MSSCPGCKTRKMSGDEMLHMGYDDDDGVYHQS